VAVRTASSQLHHSLSSGHAGPGIVSYLMVFFAIWWAWMNFTWFATSFGVDDWLYRVITIVQMAGVLGLAAGIGPVFDEHDPDFTIVVVAYVVMRVAMIVQWLRLQGGPGAPADHARLRGGDRHGAGAVDRLPLRAGRGQDGGLPGADARRDLRPGDRGAPGRH